METMSNAVKDNDLSGMGRCQNVICVKRASCLRFPLLDSQKCCLRCYLERTGSKERFPEAIDIVIVSTGFQSRGTFQSKENTYQTHLKLHASCSCVCITNHWYNIAYS